MIDIFDENGRYLDNFYLKINGSLMAVREDDIFIREKDEVLVKGGWTKIFYLKSGPDDPLRTKCS